MKPPVPQKSRAILIGSADYAELEPLPGVARNLMALQEQLMRSEVWGLSPQHCVVVEDPADQDAMIEPVHALGDEATEALVVYYAGHGLLNGRGELTLARPSTPRDRGRGYFKTVAYDVLRQAVLHSPARHKVVILDCCFSGSAVDTMGSGDVASQTHIEGTFVLASAPPTHTALAPREEDFTAFTGELLGVMQDGIPDEARVLTLDVIFAHIRRNLISRGLPEPWAQRRNDGGTLPFIMNVAAVQAKPPPGYGGVPGVDEREPFNSRQDAREAGVHRPLRAGICGTKDAGGAESIVVSGGYEDDEDRGNVIIYTGHGGQKNGIQIADQRATASGNAALIASITSRYPVRVVRGSGSKSSFAPDSGFRYDGLYTVENYWTKVRPDGFRVLQFRLEKLQDSRPPLVPTGTPTDRAGVDLSRWEPVALGVYRDRRISAKVSKAHNYACQICGVVIESPAGFQITPTTHLKPLTVPHKGPDIPENVLCLCPNHRVELDLGVITIEDDLQVINEIHVVPVGVVDVNSKHKVGLEYIRYHRELFRRRRGA
ncbi:YDG/SRA domain-containing protein [Actinomadura sp. 6N118]|uniref:caspase, EACC1-associated type n=1 Tax=Actinomadura sp. 6N118 TaxID=3375151 RepID=UPI003793FA9D